MHRSVLALAAAALVLAGCDSAPTSPAPASAAPALARSGPPGPDDGHPSHQHSRSPYKWVTMNPCLPVPEQVLIEGFSQYNAHFKFVDGGNNSRLKRDIHATGIGVITRAKYQYLEMWTTYGKYTVANDRWETEQTTRYHVISQGSLGNFFSTVKMKIVYQNGVLASSEVISVESDCRG